MPEKRLFQERLTEGAYRPVVTAYYFKQWNGYSMGFHQHATSEIMYVMSGGCAVELEDGRRRQAADSSGAAGAVHRVELAKGEFIMLDANVPHRLIVEGSCRMLNLEFRFEEKPAKTPFPATSELAKHNEELRGLFMCERSYLKLREPHDIYYTLRSLVTELDRGVRDASDMDMVQLLIAQLLIRIARLYKDSQERDLDVRDTYVRSAMEYVRHNYDRAISVQEVASAVNLHPGYLQRIFKWRSGTTLMGFLTDYRMEKAKMLLRQTDTPIAEVADYVGVGSRQYFHQLFKTHTGMTPVQYRQAIVLEQRGLDRRSGEDF